MVFHAIITVVKRNESLIHALNGLICEGTSQDNITRRHVPCLSRMLVLT